MKKLYWIIVWLVIISFFSVGSSYAAYKKPVKKQNIVINKQINLDSELYKKAEIELDRQLYREYRVAERIIRANKLDNYPWVIEIPNGKDYVVNASTQNGNLITIECGTINTFYDDVSALASVTAHEMAHEILRHIYRQTRYNQILDKSLQDDVNTTDGSMNSFINRYSFLIPGIGSAAYNYANYKAEQEKRILENKKMENEYDKLAFSRKCEYEADKLGLIMMIKAGFDPKAFNRKFEFYKRLPSGLEEDMDHPVNDNRIWQVNTLLKSLNISQLKKEGLYNIRHSRPLTYEKSFYKEKDSVRKKTIVINSKFATENPNDPFKKMFGK